MASQAMASMIDRDWTPPNLMHHTCGQIPSGAAERLRTHKRHGGFQKNCARVEDSFLHYNTPLDRLDLLR
jgi:hypothetical protein